MAKLEQVNVDLSALGGVDLSKSPNRRLGAPKFSRQKLDLLSGRALQLSISAASHVSSTGEWASIPQDFDSGALTVSYKRPGATYSVPPQSLGVSLGGTLSTIIGPTVNVGLYLQMGAWEFGLIGGAGISLSTSVGLVGAIELVLVDGPISLLDGVGYTLAVEFGASAGTRAFAGFGLILNTSFKCIGCLFEFGAGLDVAPPVSLTATVTNSGHVKVL